MATLMTKPTHFFLGLLSDLFSSAKIAQPVDVEAVLKENNAGNTARHNPISPDAPALDSPHSNERHVGFAFCYGAASNPKWWERPSCWKS